MVRYLICTLIGLMIGAIIGAIVGISSFMNELDERIEEMRRDIAEMKNEDDDE